MDYLEKQRIRRKLTGDRDTKKYEKTPKGFLMRCYRNMQSRVTGVQKLKAHLYLGKELLDRNTFYEFSLGNAQFNYLFDVWVKNNYDRKLSPSIDRRDSDKGYTIDNIRWLTHSENSKLGQWSRFNK